MVGPLAEERITGHYNIKSATNDADRVADSALAIYGDRARRHVNERTRLPKRVLIKHWTSVERVAKALLERQTLREDDVKTLYLSQEYSDSILSALTHCLADCQV